MWEQQRLKPPLKLKAGIGGGPIISPFMAPTKSRVIMLDYVSSHKLNQVTSPVGTVAPEAVSFQRRLTQLQVPGKRALT